MMRLVAIKLSKNRMRLSYPLTSTYGDIDIARKIERYTKQMIRR